MAEIPQIPADEPVVVPAASEATYPDLYITDLFVQADYADFAKTKALVVLYPYNYTTKQALVEQSRRTEYRIDDLWSAAAHMPLLAQTMGQLTYVVSLMRQKESLESRLTAALDGEDVSALQTALATVKTNLGITE